MNQLKDQIIILLNFVWSVGMCLTFWSCSNAQKKLIIVPLHSLENIDTSQFRGKMAISKMSFYLVQGYKNNKVTERSIDDFVHRNKDSNWLNYSQYQVIFYKESNETNVKNIKAFPRVIVRYSQDHDWIYSYKWSDGQFLYKWKIKNGKIIKPKQSIRLEDIPD